MFAAAGAFSWAVADATPVSPRAADIHDKWIATGGAGDMAFAYRNTDVRNDPRLLFGPGKTVRSLAICLFAYPTASAGQHPASAHIAEYALGPDYHLVIKQRLQPIADAIAQSTGLEARVYVDTAPLRERYWAAKAGLGFIGKNQMLTVPGKGAHFCIATVATEAHLESVPGPFAVRNPQKSRQDPPATGCSGCGKCAAACPSGALKGDGTCDTRRCIAYLTTECRATAKGCVDGRIFGCDICRRVCPHHNPGAETAVTVFAANPDLLQLTPEAWQSMTRGQKRRLTQGTALSRKPI